MSQFLCTVLLLLTSGALLAQNKSIEFAILFRSTALGGWFCWKGVYDVLVKDGYNISIVQQPETSFKDDVASAQAPCSARWTMHSCRS